MKKICKHCKKEFETSAGQRRYCSQFCRWKYYDIHSRGKTIYRGSHKPKGWRCQHCEHFQELDFDIKNNKKKWFDVKCEKCGKYNIG